MRRSILAPGAWLRGGAGAHQVAQPFWRDALDDRTEIYPCVRCQKLITPENYLCPHCRKETYEEITKEFLSE